MSISSTGSQEPSSSQKNMWNSPWIAKPLAGMLAIVPLFGEQIAKTDLQKGKTPAPLFSTKHLLIGWGKGVKAAPWIGSIVSAQMRCEKEIVSAFQKEGEKPSLLHKLASSSVVGLASSLPIAIFNGLTGGMGIRQTFLSIRSRQIAAVAGQEAGFVAGMSQGDGGYAEKYISGALGSLAGHPCNTILTCSQHNISVEKFRIRNPGPFLEQMYRGAMRRANAAGLFAVAMNWLDHKLSSK